MPIRHAVPLCLLLAIACSGEAEQAATHTTNNGSIEEELVVDLAGLLPEAPRPEPYELAGGAEVMEEQATPEAPRDVLGTRAQVRALPLPRVRRGANASFEMPTGGGRGWVTSLPNRQVLLTPAFGHDRVYVGGGFSSTTMFALDSETGAVEWSVTAPDGGPTAAVVYDDKVLFNTESCTLFVVQADTGRIIWSRWLGDPLMSMPAVDGDRVFSGHLWTGSPTNYGFSAMALRNGRVLWQRAAPHDVISAPTTHGDSVYFTTMDGSVYRLLQRNGRRVWQRRLRATTAPWVDGDRVLLARRVPAPAGERGRFEQQVILDAANGDLIWEGESVPARHLAGGGRARAILVRQAGAWGGGNDHAQRHLGVRNVAEGWAYQGPRPTVVDGRAYQVVGERIECRRLEDGELLWSRRYTQDAGALSMSPPAVVGSQMVIATVDGHVYGLDIDTGMTIWAYDVGEPLVYQPSVARGTVYVSTAHGRVVAFPVGDESLDGWHMWGGNPAHSGLTVDPSDLDYVDDDALLNQDADSNDEDGFETDDQGPGEGEMRVVLPGDHRIESLPLEHTSVEAEISGFVAAVTVEQVFTNPHDEPLEAAYHFPLPTGAAVDSMLVRAGDRVILGRIKRREVARVIYRRAREAGLLAALLEQQRPNLFTQRVANIPPGESVRVEIHYVQLLPYDSGEYEFMFPMVAGARAQDPTAEEEGDDVEQHTPGLRPSEAIDLSIRIDSGVPLEDLDSPSHLIDVDYISDVQARVTLAREDRVPNRDLVVRYRVAGDLPRAAVLSHQDERGGFFTLMVQPGLEVPTELATRRRLTFAVDTSSSMLGRPLVQAQAIVNEALATLGEEDELQVIGFSDMVQTFSAHPLNGTDEHVIDAENWVDDLRALGTTSMTAGLSRALEQQPSDEDVLETVVLITDGYVASEQELFRLVHERLGHRRLSTVGLGPAPNRFLLERLAEFGRGTSLVVSPADHPEVVAQDFLERIENPQLTDLEIDWGELTIHSVYPRRPSDLFEGQPLLVRGRYDAPGEGYVTVRGRMGGRQWEERVPVVLASADRTGSEAMAPIWARAAVHDLMNGLYLRDDPDREDAITDLGLRFGLVTRFTSFVAVEEAFLQSLGGANGQGALFGYPGLGLIGTGRGGGGYGEGTIGLGSLNTIGHGGGGGSGSAYGAAGSNMLRSVAAVRAPAIRTGSAMIRGSLSADTVRRRIRMHSAQFRHAYENQLRSSPGLSGRIVVRVVIGPTGQVLSAEVTSSSMDNEELHQAILGIFRRMTFPDVEGGGTVVVSYPLVFVQSE